MQTDQQHQITSEHSFHGSPEDLLDHTHGMILAGMEDERVRISHRTALALCDWMMDHSDIPPFRRYAVKQKLLMAKEGNINGIEVAWD